MKSKQQIRKLYLVTILTNLSLTGAWVAILAARGFSLVEIGLAETVFHICSLIFEIPSGILADLYGRKRMLALGRVAAMTGDLIMIFSRGLGMVCLSFVFHAMSYNFASGSGEALAYDSLKEDGRESSYEGYVSTSSILYRLFGGISTLCARSPSVRPCCWRRRSRSKRRGRSSPSRGRSGTTLPKHSAF